MLFGSGIAERYYERWFTEQLLASGADATYRSLGFDTCGLSITGPNARLLLERITDDDLRSTVGSGAHVSCVRARIMHGDGQN